MNSLKQFLSLAVQNAEETPDEVMLWLFFLAVAACVVFGMGVMCWLRWKIQKKHNPNLTAGQFWRAVFTQDCPNL